MTYLEQLQALVKELREELGDDFANLLLATPHSSQVPGYQLLTMGLKIWPITEDVRHHASGRGPVSKKVTDLLDILVKYGGHLTVWSSKDVIALNGPLTDVLIENPKWGPVYLAIAAWYELHQPCFETPAPLPEDPVECFKLLHYQIKTAGPGYDMAPALECLEKFGVTGDLPAECISRKHVQKPPVSIMTLLKIVERQPTSYYGIGNAVSYTDSENDTVRVAFPKKLAPIVSAIFERRNKLFLKWPPG